MSSQVASLLHDDVLDDADTRRGIGSLNFVMGNKVYIKLCPICQHIICHWCSIVWLYFLYTYCQVVGVGCLILFFFFYAVGSIGWRFSSFSGLRCSCLFEKHWGKLNGWYAVYAFKTVKMCDVSSFLDGGAHNCFSAICLW